MPIKLYMSVWREQWPDKTGSAAATHSPSIHSGYWVESGTLHHNDAVHQSGSGFYLTPSDRIENQSDKSATAIRISLSDGPVSTGGQVDNIIEGASSSLILEQSFTTDISSGILRFDQVDFPPAAVAYRHTHPGAGLRYLCAGGLQITGDHEQQMMHAGDAWFEDANSPVLATAIDTEPSRFIRLMLLPPEYAGKPTLTLLDAVDKDKPRLQTNTRHFDQPVVVS